MSGSDPARIRDVLGPGLAILLVGFNPGLRSGAAGHHYAGPGNQFWRLLAGAGLTPPLPRPGGGGLLPEFGLGLTNLVARPTASAADLAPGELRAGVPRLRELVGRCGPRIVAYTGKGVYLAAAAWAQAPWGLQADRLFGRSVDDFVLPSPSGLVRLSFAEKLRWYSALAEHARATG